MDVYRISQNRETRKRIVLLFLAALILLIAVFIVVLAVTLRSQNADESTFKLHVNPADPVVLSSETPEGDIIYLLGNKSLDTGISQSLDEFRVESDDGITFISLNENGRIESAHDNMGLQIDFDWDENQTIVHVSVIFNNGSEQLTINVNYSDPFGGNFSNFEPESIPVSKRSLQDMKFHQETFSQHVIRKKRQATPQSFATVTITAETCDEPEANAKIFANILFDFDEQTGSSSQSAQYYGSRTDVKGKYIVRIPTRSASDIGETKEEICEKIEMFLSDICLYYSRASKITRHVTGGDFEPVFCFILGAALQNAFPTLGISVISHFCKNIFKPLKWHCKNANKNTEFSPDELLCKSLPVIDNGVNLVKKTKIVFSPYAIFPRGNRVNGNQRILEIPPGTSSVPETFHIINDQLVLQITDLLVTPFDPAPHERYSVYVAFTCYFEATLAVEMSVVGTDDYQGSTQCFTGPSCIIYVPGAKALVRDDVSIVIKSGGSTISRKIVIIF